MSRRPGIALADGAAAGPYHGALRPQWLAFVDAYCSNGGKAHAAALAAGYAPGGARVAGFRLLTNEAVKAEIVARRAETQKLASITALEVVEELANIGRARITDIATWNGHGLVFEASRDLEPEVVAAIKEIREIRRIQRSKDGSEYETVEMRITMHDKLSALAQLARMMGLNPADGGDASTVLNLFIDARRQSGAEAEPFGHLTAASTLEAMRHMMPLLEADAARDLGEL